MRLADADAFAERLHALRAEARTRAARYGARLTPDEERAALVAYQQGDRGAGRALCQAHEGFLRTKTRKWRRLCDEDDLLQEARAELLRSARDYDLAFEVRLLTFAEPRIFQRLRRYARANAASVAPSTHGTEAFRDVEWTERAWARVANAPTEGELCQAIDLRSEVRRTRKRRAEVLTLRLQGLNHEEIAAELGISRQRCQQLEADGWWPVVAGDLRDTTPIAIGQRYGCIVVQSEAGKSSHNGETQFACLCDCGRVKVMRKSHIARSRACRCGVVHERVKGRFGKTKEAA